MVFSEIICYNTCKRVSILSHYLYIASKEVNVSYTIMNNIDYKVGIYIRLSREDEEKRKNIKKVKVLETKELC